MKYRLCPCCFFKTTLFLLFQMSPTDVQKETQHHWGDWTKTGAQLWSACFYGVSELNNLIALFQHSLWDIHTKSTDVLVPLYPIPTNKKNFTGVQVLRCMFWGSICIMHFKLLQSNRKKQTFKQMFLFIILTLIWYYIEGRPYSNLRKIALKLVIMQQTFPWIQFAVKLA